MECTLTYVTWVLIFDIQPKSREIISFAHNLFLSCTIIWKTISNQLRNWKWTLWIHANSQDLCSIWVLEGCPKRQQSHLLIYIIPCKICNALSDWLREYDVYKKLTQLGHFGWCYPVDYNSDHFVCAPNQWETTLHCNVVSHWLDAYTKRSLYSSV